MTIARAVFAAGLAMLVASARMAANRTQASDDSEGLVRWAKANARPIKTANPGRAVTDLEPLRAVVGAARIVGVGESVHGIREFLGLRQRMVQFLVDRMGFTAVALESGLPDSKAVYDYVLGIEAPARMWDEGFTWTMATFGETRDLIEWLRAYNRDPAHTRKIRFYGMDVAGANGSWAPALRQVLDYLERVEPPYAALVREKLMPLVEKFAKAEFTESNDEYAKLSLKDRNAVAALVNELADRFDLLRPSYLAAGSVDDYDWARQIALNLRYANALVTNYEARNRGNPIWSARDRAMAENVRWILAREGSGGVVVLAHNAHVQTSMSTQVAPNMASLGVFLRGELGKNYRNVGFTFNRGAMWGKPGELVPLGPADRSSLDGAMARVGRSMFFLDFGRLPARGPARRWLSQPVKQRIQGFYTTYDQLRSWNALIFVDSITPSRLAATGSSKRPGR